MCHLTERCGRHECADTRRIGLDRFLKERGQRATGSGSHRACRRRSHRRPEPAAGRGRAVPRAGAAHRRRRGLRQNPRADAPHRLDPHPVRRLAQPDPGHHVHQQGRRRDARTPDRADRAGGPAHVGVHLPLRLRAHPAARRRADRAEIRILHLRHRRLRAPGQAHRRRSEHRPQTLHAPLHPGAHLRLQEQPAGLAGAAEHLRGRLQTGPEGLPARPVRQRGGAVRGRLRRIPAPARHGERRGLRRPDRAHRRTAARLPDGRRILPAQVPLHPRRRVPGHQPRAVRARAGAGRRGRGGAAPAGRRGRRAAGAGVDHRRRRLRPVDLRVPWRGHPQHPGLRTGLPERQDHHARTELPFDADHPGRGERGHRTQRGPQAQETVDRAGQGRADRRLRRGQRPAGGGVDRLRDRAAARRTRHRLLRHGRHVPGQRTVALAGGGADQRRTALPAHRRHTVLRAPGDQGRHRLPTGHRQPGGRREHAAHPQRAQARAGPPSRIIGHHVRRHARHHVLRRRAPRGRARRPHPHGHAAQGVPRPDDGIARIRRCAQQQALRDCGRGALQVRPAGGAAALGGPPGRLPRREPLAAAVRGGRIRAEDPGRHAGGVPGDHGAGGRFRPAADGRGGFRLGDVDDPAYGQGSGVSGGVPHRTGAGHVPAFALAGGYQRAGGGAASGLRGHHARATAPVRHTRRGARPVGPGRRDDAQPVPR